MDDVELESLVGETLTHIDVSEGESRKQDEILLTTQSGRQIRITHDQDCCESVYIEDTEGNWHELVGKPLLEATKDISYEGEPPFEHAESWTRTALKFKTDNATVISRWVGESNGYYSEDVDLHEIAK